MSLTFADIPPVPVDPRIAARQALHMQKLIDDAGGIPQAVDEAVDAIFAVDADDDPSELSRLRLLYQHAYTRAELERLTMTTFVELGLAEGP
jgi:hypothetical protein